MSATLRAAPPADDQRHRRAVLILLLTSYPALLTPDEVQRALVADDSFAERDAVGRALRDLGADGLLHRPDGFVVLTRATVRTAALLEDP